MNKKEQLKKQIDALDFAIYEMVLFLDTHPNDRSAMAAFQEYKQRRKNAIKEYEAAFGPYIKRIDNVPPGNRWSWINSPWPWEN